MTISAPCFQYWPRASKGFLPPAMAFQRLATGYTMGPAGLLVPTSSNVPRLYYDPANIGNAQGTLIEQSSTNLCLQSQTLTTSPWVNTGSVTVNVSTAPDGSVTAAQVSTSTVFNGVYQAVTVSNSTTYTFSAFIKYVSGNNLWFFGTNINPSTGNMAINCQTGSVSGTSGLISYSSQAFPNGWIRFSCTYASTGTSNALNITADASGASACLMWGVQLEQASQPTSYIPTTSAAVTRAADSLSIPLSSIAGYNNAAGTLMVSGWTPLVTPGADAVLACLDDGTTSNQIKVRYTTAGHLACDLVGGSGATMDLGAYAANTYFAAALNWAAGSQAASLNSAACVTASAATLPSGLVTLRIGSAAAANYANSAGARVALYSRQFSNTDTQATAA